MATRLTDLIADQRAPGVRSRPEGRRVTGKIQYARSTYTTLGTEAAADVIDVVDLPPGVIPLAHLSRVSSEALGGTGTAISMLGDVLDPDRYSATSIALTAAIASAVTPVPANEVAPYAVTKETTTIKATLALTSGAVTAGKKVYFLIAYLPA